MFTGLVQTLTGHHWLDYAAQLLSRCDCIDSGDKRAFGNLHLDLAEKRRGKKKNAVNEMTKDGKYCVSTYKWLDIWLKHANSLTLIIITHLIELEKSPPEMQFRSFAFIPNPISKLNCILPWIYPGSDADIPVPPMHFSISAATGIHWPSIVISMSPKKGNCVRARAFHGCGITTPHLFPRIFRKIKE